jgi:type II secretory pathway component GspD/PulD (secretin)
MRRLAFFSIALAFYLIIFPACFSLAQMETRPGERIIACMIQLEHADAEELAAVLEPLLSPQGSIVPYRPTNTLIIKDRASVVDKLSIAIKGRPCTQITEQPSVENR